MNFQNFEDNLFVAFRLKISARTVIQKTLLTIQIDAIDEFYQDTAPTFYIFPFLLDCVCMLRFKRKIKINSHNIVPFTFPFGIFPLALHAR